MRSKLIILGCGSSVGVPRIDGYWGKCNVAENKNKRSRCSAIIIKGKNHVLIDTSPDLKYQLLSNKIKNITSVIFTHEHADQTNGLFELRPFFWKYKKKIDTYADSSTLSLLKKRHDYLFMKVGSYSPILNGHVIKSNFSLGKLKEKINFTIIKVKHGKIDSLGYIFEQTAYIGDCNDLSIVKMKELKNLKYLIIDCLKYKKHPTHFNLDEALYVHNILQPKKTILTNLHHDLDYHKLVRKLPQNVSPAFDGMQIYL